MKPALYAVPGSVLAGCLLAWAGSQHGLTVGAAPIFAVLVGAAFMAQWIAFVPAWLKRTEHFYDLVGGSTYFCLAAGAILLTEHRGLRDWVLGALIMIWSARLATFLFRRVRKKGSDARFDAIKVSFSRYLIAWTLQGLWIVATAGAALAAITTAADTRPGPWLVVGLTVWVAGFGIEVVADRQKRDFRSDSSNEEDFISSGLWSWSRHPNYLGEIILWLGVALIAAPELRGWQHATLISPLFVYVLLRFGSGVPILERRADEKWGGRPDYERYKERTPVLIPGVRSGGS